MLDLRTWAGLYDAAVAIERVPTYIREIRFNFDRYGLGALPHWVVRQRIEDFLAIKGEEAEQVFDGIPAWPCLINYDPFDNPLPLNTRTFPRDKGLWASLKSFLQVQSIIVPRWASLGNVQREGPECDLRLRDPRNLRGGPPAYSERYPRLRDTAHRRSNGPEDSALPSSLAPPLRGDAHWFSIGVA